MSMNKVVITLAAILTMTAAEASYAYPTAIYGEDGISYRLESVKHSGEYMTAEYKAESEAPITIEKLKSNMPFPREAYKIPDDKSIAKVVITAKTIEGEPPLIVRGKEAV